MQFPLVSNLKFHRPIGLPSNETRYKQPTRPPCFESKNEDTGLLTPPIQTWSLLVTSNRFQPGCELFVTGLPFARTEPGDETTGRTDNFPTLPILKIWTEMYHSVEDDGQLSRAETYLSTSILYQCWSFCRSLAVWICRGWVSSAGPPPRSQTNLTFRFIISTARKSPCRNNFC